MSKKGFIDLYTIFENIIKKSFWIFLSSQNQSQDCDPLIMIFFIFRNFDLIIKQIVYVQVLKKSLVNYSNSLRILMIERLIFYLLRINLYKNIFVMHEKFLKLSKYYIINKLKKYIWRST